MRRNIKNGKPRQGQVRLMNSKLGRLSSVITRPNLKLPKIPYQINLAPFPLFRDIFQSFIYLFEYRRPNNIRALQRSHMELVICIQVLFFYLKINFSTTGLVCKLEKNSRMLDEPDFKILVIYVLHR